MLEAIAVRHDVAEAVSALGVIVMVVLDIVVLRLRPSAEAIQHVRLVAELIFVQVLLLLRLLRALQALD